MIKMQTNLNNFSIAKEILSFFKDHGNSYDLFIENGVVFPDIKECPKCVSKISKNGTNDCHDEKAKAFGLIPKKGRIVCSTRGCDFKINIKHSIFQKWFSSLDELIEAEILSLGTKKMTSSKIAQHLRETKGIYFSDEYIRMKLKKLTDKIEAPSPQYKPSGVVVHDEQFLKIKGVDLKRISTVDANNPNVYYDSLHLDRTEETMTKICHELRDNIHDIRATVIDGHTASKNAYKNVFINVIIQYCLFHFAMNVRDAYKKEVGYGKGRSAIPLQYLIGFFSILNVFFNHDREIIELRQLQKKLNGHIERVIKTKYDPDKKQEYIEDYKKNYDKKAYKYLKKVKKMRRRKRGLKLTLKTEEQAKELFKKAKLENIFPKEVQKQVVRLEKNWIDFTHCLRDETIPPTSNKIEQYYSITLNWIEKNNLQSEEQFYKEKKFSLARRYGLEIIRKGIFTEFLRKTFVMLAIFGIT